MPRSNWPTPASSTTIPAPADSFDAVLASLSLMYVIDRAAAANEIARVMRPGGRFAITFRSPHDLDLWRINGGTLIGGAGRFEARRPAQCSGRPEKLSMSAASPTASAIA
ncbi:MAG: class I SAM-dependent methyltransferase [Sphingopyxis sp.]|nr:class I SAM-dependent methyltransferase [Sphingopyxis sp.]